MVRLTSVFNPHLDSLLLSLLSTRAAFLLDSLSDSYQNVGIATAVALSMFDGNDQAKAIGVPLYYGFAEVVILAVFCLYSWKRGWTFAPARAREVLHRSVEPEHGDSGVLFTDPATELYALVYILTHVRVLNGKKFILLLPTP